jgi:hypothetical protein
LVLLVAVAGCAEMASSLIEDGIHAACGESRQERGDRHAMECYREHWATPGRTEIEAEARGTFRRTNDRDPNLNWHVR